MKYEQTYYSHTDPWAACYPELLLTWTRGAPGLSGFLDLGPGIVTAPDGKPFSCVPLVHGVMDDFGTFVVTEVEP